MITNNSWHSFNSHAYQRLYVLTFNCSPSRNLKSPCIFKEKRNIPLQNMSLWRRNYLKLNIYKKEQIRKQLWKPSSNCLLVREIYIYKGNLHFKGFLLFSTRNKALGTFIKGEGKDLSLHNNYPLVYCALPDSLI